MEGFSEFFWKFEKKYICNSKNDKRNGSGAPIFKAKSSYNSIMVNPNINDNNIIIMF
jgi:hypothetical protein